MVDLPPLPFDRLECILIHWAYPSPPPRTRHSGLASIVPLAYLHLLTPSEINESMVCGRDQVDVELLKANTHYGDDYTIDHPAIVVFWEAFDNFTEEERRALFRFAWGRSRLPTTLVWEQKFTIDKMPGGDAVLPRAHTCYNTMYESGCFVGCLERTFVWQTWHTNVSLDENQRFTLARAHPCRAAICRNTRAPRSPTSGSSWPLRRAAALTAIR